MGNDDEKLRIVVASEKMIDELPEDAKKELESVMKKLAEGEEVGIPVDFERCKIQLLCPSCQSKNVNWLLDKNSQEVTFVCKDCPEKYWQTIKEYEDAIKKFPECIITQEGENK